MRGKAMTAGRFLFACCFSVLVFLVARGALAQDDSAALRSLLEEFLAGASVSDAAMHRRFWAEDLVYTSSSGRRYGKPTILRGLSAPPADEGPALRYSAEQVRIDLLSDSHAVVTFRLVASAPDGTRSHYLNTGVFEKSDGEWRAKVWQATKAAAEDDVSPSHGAGASPEERLAALGITLPPAPSPVANYVNGVRTGNLVFLAGKGPKRADGTEIHGKLGADLGIEEGYAAARLTAINQLAVLKTMLGDLGRVERVVKVLGMVNSDPAFVEQPAVVNGFSDLIVEVFGDRGRHARAAVGMASLPRGQAVEIEMIVEVRD
jgi:enamine deaminase RidA (YjgF/YER057c/UK114 family)